MISIEPVPADALPDCESCDKPELLPSNQEVVHVYNYVVNQQVYAAMGGERLGVRMEAVLETIRWLSEGGELSDPDLVFRRIFRLDAAVNAVSNAANANKREAASKR